MKILRIACVPNNRLGGMSRVMHFTTDEMISTGHHVDTVWEEDFGTIVFPRFGRFVNPARLPNIVISKQKKEGIRYDIVEIHEPLSAGYCIARSFGCSLPPPVVLSYGVESRGHHLSVAYRRMKSLPVSIKQRFSPLSVTVQSDYGLKHCTQVICFNSDDEEYLRQRGVPGHRIVRTHSGISLAFLHAGQMFANNPKVRDGILFLASWLERKGILDLIPSIEIVLQRFPKIRFTVAGCGASSTAVLAAFSPEIRSRINVISKVTSDDELLAIYKQNSIYVLPSFLEGQPLSMLEAAAMGLAIVTTNVCGMRDFIQHNVNGLLVSPGNPDQLVLALERLICDRSEAHRLGEAARQSVQSMTWKSVAQDMTTAYSRATHSNRGFR